MRTYEARSGMTLRSVEVTILKAPLIWWQLPQSAKECVTGGCGPGGLGDYLVMDSFFGLSIFDACQIHDFMWHIGDTEEDRQIADKTFLDNMKTLIRAAHSGFILKALRMAKAYCYYWAVASPIGKFLYWKDKK